jgi:hypothetical protein
MVNQLKAEKEKRLNDLEKKWTKKIDEDDLDEDEDDTLETDAVERESSSNDLDMTEGNEEDWTNEEDSLTTLIKNVITERKSTWKSLVERLEVEAEQKQV